MRNIVLTTIVVLLCTAFNVHAQEDTSSVIGKITNFPNSLFHKANRQIARINDGLSKKTQRYLRKIVEKENKLKKQWMKIDSNAAKLAFANDPASKYQSLSTQLKNDTISQQKNFSGTYLPYADSFRVVGEFISKNTQHLNAANLVPKDLQASLHQITTLQAKMQDAEQIENYLKARKEKLKEYLLQYANVPPALKQLYTQYNTEFYYYSAQVESYKSIINDPDKMLQSALAVLDKIPAFSSFMEQNSILSGLFGNASANGNSLLVLQGLQTRDQVTSMIQSQIGGGGSNAAAAFTQNVQSAQQRVSELKDKLLNYGNQAGGGADLMPGFVPNNQKTKSFWNRLEFGSNIQNTSSSYFFPSTSDIGLSLGYKLNKGNVVGIGASYKMGWGNGLQHMRISSEGIGLRSFLDVKIKNTYFITGGFEYNYQQPFDSYSSLKNLTEWSKSGLIGISKVISVKSKAFKKTKLQLLWDFLSYYQIPRTQPFKFRVGYSF